MCDCIVPRVDIGIWHDMFDYNFIIFGVTHVIFNCCKNEQSSLLQV
jgi:hypothetical protein